MLVKQIQRALQNSTEGGWGYGGMTLDAEALIHLCRRMPERKDPYHILELGGGQSTIFWKTVIEMELLPIRVTTIEHNSQWVSTLQERVEEVEGIDIFSKKLKQISDQEWENIFTHPTQAQELWRKMGNEVPESDYNVYTIHNCFYDDLELPLSKDSVDVMIVDGPHGNGRSLAYPLFREVLKPDALVLIDDFDHYPFIQDFAKIFCYEDIYRKLLREERWALVRITNKK
jgi:hypothetical protein